MISTAELLTGLTIGLMGSGHCGAMCGGIASALGTSVEGQGRYLKLTAFHLGRILSYTLIAIIIGGALSMAGSSLPALNMILRLLAGLLLVTMGLYIAGWWPGITLLEKAAQPLWARIQPLTIKLIPPPNAGAALLLGGLWGWLPCGMVYSALAWSVTSGDSLEASMRMLSFGLGTVPAMLTLSIAAQKLREVLQHQYTRKVAGVLLIAFGCWTLVTPAGMLGADSNMANEKGHGHHHGSHMAQ